LTFCPDSVRNVAAFSNELASASFELGKLDGLQRNLPNPQILISPLLVKEATISSRIEGTVSTVSDVLEYEATGEPRHPDTIEVSNYKRAMLMAMGSLKERNLSLSFIKALHQTLLEKTRGHSARGKFRKEQVWVGNEGDPIEKATYIPPEHFMVQDFMENLERYILGNSEHPLVKVGIIHYQFEAIYPFKDGNGRMGRLLIPLYLYWKKLLYQPILYISGYFEKNRGRYIDELSKADRTVKLEDWLKFFLASVKKQSEETQKLISKIDNLKKEIEETAENIKSPYIYKVVNYLFTKPIFRTSDMGVNLRIHERTARRLLAKLVKLKLLSLLKAKDRKENIYIFTRLISLLSY
jgi:Fic family protein